MAKKIFWGILAVLIIIQFFRPSKNEAPPSSNAIAAKYAVPEEVNTILKRSCFDCHSNNTVYPWYTNIQPIGWWLNDHIRGGQGELNFDEFATYDNQKARHKLEEVAEAVTEGWMPYDKYLWMHKDAALNPEEIKLVADWAEDLRVQIPANP